MKPIIFPLYAAESFTANLKTHLNANWGSFLLHEFPDQETYVRIETEVRQRDVILLATLDNPNTKILPLIFASNTAKKLGANRVSLLAPYLAYMRQDKQFNPGEGITSEYFAALISQHFDSISTMDPHLHRHHEMREIYTIPSQVLHADDFIAQWIKKQIQNPLIIGPDQESEQWVAQVAQKADAPYLVLTKIRRGDHEVDVSIPAMTNYQQHTPVLVDDIISTARTMIAAVQQLKALTTQAIVCVGIHGLFTGNAYQDLQKAGAAIIATCNTVEHPSNKIDVSRAFI